MANCFMKEDARPARAKHNRHSSSGRRNCIETQDRLTSGLTREGAPAVLIKQKIKLYTSTTTMASLLPGRALGSNTCDLQSQEGLSICDHSSRRGKNQDLFLLNRQ